ncbi:type I polyketide synthase [Crateriforma spongiae]|uniref:type I polyketide synthase n=1 Tax=Crateriforma spongiae TaxID=2724528 RepID=UPI001447E4C0|nr:type I polyketide synthase [Crateriforma spongiae]
MPAPSSKPNSVLLTGATGMVGCHLLDRLIDRRRNVVCLVRGQNDDQARHRVDEVLKRFGRRLDDHADQIEVVAGDLSAEAVGLSPIHREHLAARVDTVLHCAASLSFRPASESVQGEPYRTNVDGTRHLVQLARQIGVKDFHYVSTAYVCGARRGRVLEADLDHGQSFANDYERSKLLAEQMLRNTPGIRVSFYRPSIVIDSTGRSPVTADRTVYGAFQTYRALASRFGLPREGGWFSTLGFTGDERKNLVEADWVADSIVALMHSPPHHQSTYHLTAPSGTPIQQLETAFREACRREGVAEQNGNESAEASAVFQTMAAPYVRTFLPYFNNDPEFDRSATSGALTGLGRPVAGDVTTGDLIALLSTDKTVSPAKIKAEPPVAPLVREDSDDQSDDGDPLVIAGFDVCLPGGAVGRQAFADLLFANRSAIDEVPHDRFDRSLYFDPRRGQIGKSYTTLGGCVGESAIGPDVVDRAARIGQFDPCHLQFATVALSAWQHAGAEANEDLAARCGIYVGHSGGTKLGGPLAMSTLAEVVSEQIREVADFPRSNDSLRGEVTATLARRLRETRPHRKLDAETHFNAYSAASLSAQLLNLGGPREVVDAACASSLVALQHAATAIQAGRIDTAIVGGATYNSVDNLILFSQSQACSDEHSCPFDENASGLISSEGYVAVVLTRRSTARHHGLNELAELVGVGLASDGRGKSLWAPRTEGQQLAIRRAYDRSPALSIDYMECHATSTQVGDATELTSLSTLLETDSNRGPGRPLAIGSAKSNFGHTLEAAGLVGLTKVLVAMQHETLPASLNFKSPTPHFDWTQGRLSVVDHNQAWPVNTNRQGKSAAVNAFGIGGLNAHAVIRQAGPTKPKVPNHGSNQSAVRVRPADRSSRPTPGQPIAIVGRGVVLPGANNVAAMSAMLANGRSMIASPPQDRWTGENVFAVDRQPFRTPHCLGGYIRDYQFNGQPYRIPPKQVTYANPIQMMLIDAVRQTLDELGEPADFHVPADRAVIDRRRTSVVVGTIFGGEFSNQLQVGMRVPEICRHVRQCLSGQVDVGTSIDRWMDQFAQHLIHRHPAILDETGSFTASTLASRIAKTFDLMGGACAVDADDASGMLALMTAVDQLRFGQADTVICGVAQRSLDLVAFEQLSLRDQLVRSGRPIDVPDDCRQILPGEGVAVLLLQRREDALRSGHKIHGLIDHVGCERIAAQHREDIRCDAMAGDKLNAGLVRQFGYLSGAHPIVRTVAQSIRWAQPTAADEPCELFAVAEDGFGVRASLTSGRSENDAAVSSATARHTESASPISTTSAVRVSDELGTSAMSPQATLDESIRPVVCRTDSACASSPRWLVATENDQEAIRRHLTSWAEDPDGAFASSTATFSGSTSRFTAGLVVTDHQRLAEQASRLLKLWNQGTRVTVDERACGLLWKNQPQQDRVAWLFPGQGSQYPRRPEIIDHQAESQRSLDDFDRELQTLGIAPIANRLHDPTRTLGKDVWWTQLWVLGVSHVMADCLAQAGIPMHVATGHSFGECGAALHSGAMNLAQSIRFAKQRSEAVLTNVRQSGCLLSVRGDASRIASALSQGDCDVVITHHNAPQQVVVAGTPDAVAQAKAVLSDAGLAAVVIPVPAAFHTPMMESAEKMLRQTFASHRLRPPVCPLLSSVSLRYLADPDEILENLISQLTRPVQFAATMDRLCDDGVGLMVEVGPSDVLTRLSRSRNDDRAIALSLDAGDDTERQLSLIRLATTVVTGKPSDVNRGLQPPISAATNDVRHPEVDQRIVSGATEAAITIVDVTDKRRKASQNSVPRSSGESTASLSAGDSNGHHVNGVPNGRIANGHISNGIADSHTQVNHSIRDVSSNRMLPPTDAVSAVHPTTGNASTDTTAKQASDLLVNLVVELTGYSPDIVEFDADLEAELGVDSIKKAQIIGELADWSGMKLDLAQMKLSDYTTLGDILNLYSQHFGQPDCGQPAVTAAVAPAASPPSVTDAVAIPSASAAIVSGRGSLSQSVSSLMVDFVVDQTGYSPDIVDMQADLEAELGLDSIKKAQLLGELQEQYDLSGLDLGQLKLSDFPTLGSIRDFVLEQLGEDVTTATEKKKPTDQSSVTLTPQSLDQSAFSNHRSHPHGSDTSAVAETPRGPIGGVSVEPAQGHGNGVAVGVSDVTRPVGTTFPSDNGIPTTPEVEAPARGTCRFALRTVPAARLTGMPRQPNFSGDAIVVGHNPIADEIERRFGQTTFRCHRFPDHLSSRDVDHWLDHLWDQHATPHLFVTTPRDDAALDTLDAKAWGKRRDAALMTPFRVCQRWMQRMIDDDQMDRASLLSVVDAGGNFGFDGQCMPSAESGGIAGLTKAMRIESWMRGHRETPMLIVDGAPGATASDVVDGAWRELAQPSHDEEVVVDEDERWTIDACYQPLNESGGPVGPPSRGGVWVVSGGGRGITAMTAMSLAQRYDLSLHLLGTAPNPSIDDATRNAASADRTQLRRDVIQRAQREGQNPIETWRDLEKAIEIDQTLSQCRQRGIRAVYHSVDVSDGPAINQVLQQIRTSDGPIRGVLHGAGAGQDARFDRKRPDKVAKCIGAKVDGCLQLATATNDDPLEWFIGFGSISGRFGANGHTDYSLANDMLAKCIDRLRQQRPDVRCVTFHWHAWGDIGMAAKPEAKLALEMIGMQFMPADEGLRHFMNELEYGGDLPEVLITDRRYIRKFFPGPAMRETGKPEYPMLDPSSRGIASSQAHTITLDPTVDHFLNQHTVGGKPTLPMVMAIEMMAEAAALQAGQRRITACRNVRAIAALKFHHDDAMACEVIRETSSSESDGDGTNGRSQRWRLCADLRRGDGRMVEECRTHFSGEFLVENGLPHPDPPPAPVQHGVWDDIEYLGTDAPVYHGESLQCLRKVMVDTEQSKLWGRIASPSPAHLGGEDRPLAGWQIPCAAMDACLYAAAVLAYRLHDRPSLPVGFDQIALGRLPLAGEPLLIHWSVEQSLQHGLRLQGNLSGQNGDTIARFDGYDIGWLR